MTLNDLIWRAHSHATAKEQQYQKALAEKKERDAEAEKKEQQNQNREADAVPAAPAESVPDVSGATFAPRLVMRNGQIAVDEQSLTVQVIHLASTAILCEQYIIMSGFVTQSTLSTGSETNRTAKRG